MKVFEKCIFRLLCFRFLFRSRRFLIYNFFEFFLEFFVRSCWVSFFYRFREDRGIVCGGKWCRYFI